MKRLDGELSITTYWLWSVSQEEASVWVVERESVQQLAE